MSEFRVKIPTRELYESNIKEWESQILSFLRIGDTEQYIFRYQDNEGDKFVKDNANEAKDESVKKFRMLFRRKKVQTAEALWVALPKSIQKEISDADRRNGLACKIWTHIATKIRKDKKLLEIKLISKWNNLTLDCSPSKKLQQFEEIIGDLNGLNCVTPDHIQLHKFKEIFRPKFEILIQTLEATASDGDLSHGAELTKLKNGLRNHLSRNASISETNRNSRNEPGTIFPLLSASSQTI